MKRIINNLTSFFGPCHAGQREPLPHWQCLPDFAAEPPYTSSTLTAHQGEEAELAAPTLSQPQNLSVVFCEDLPAKALGRAVGKGSRKAHGFGSSVSLTAVLLCWSRVALPGAFTKTG